MYTGADPAFLISGGPNSESFLSGLRKLFKTSKFFVVFRKKYLNFKRLYVLSLSFL